MKVYLVNDNAFSSLDRATKFLARSLNRILPDFTIGIDTEGRYIERSGGHKEKINLQAWRGIHKNYLFPEKTQSTDYGYCLYYPTTRLLIKREQLEGRLTMLGEEEKMFHKIRCYEVNKIVLP